MLTTDVQKEVMTNHPIGNTHPLKRFASRVDHPEIVNGSLIYVMSRNKTSTALIQNNSKTLIFQQTAGLCFLLYWARGEGDSICLLGYWN